MITTEKTSVSKISEALELLNEAAKEKKDELKGLLTDRYTHIKEAISSGTEHSRQIYEKAKHVTQDALLKGEEKIKEAASVVDKQAHKNPWSFVAGAAVVSLFIGYLMGSKRK